MYRPTSLLNELNALNITIVKFYQAYFYMYMYMPCTNQLPRADKNAV